MSEKKATNLWRGDIWKNLNEGWIEAEREVQANKNAAEEHRRKNPGTAQHFPRLQNPRRAEFAPNNKRDENQPFTHVPGEDPTIYDKAHHLKPFGSPREERIVDRVWGCCGYADKGLPDALIKLLPQNSPHRRAARSSNPRIAALEADGAMPPPLPKYRKLHGFQSRESKLSRLLTVPPRPPQTLSQKYKNGAYEVIQNPSSTDFQQVPRDSCVAGCCVTCGTNLRSWDRLLKNNNNNFTLDHINNQHQQEQQQIKKNKKTSTKIAAVAAAGGGGEAAAVSLARRAPSSTPILTTSTPTPSRASVITSTTHKTSSSSSSKKSLKVRPHSAQVSSGRSDI